MENIEIRELVASLGSDDDSLRKMAAFKLQSIISDPSFADMFIAEGGLPNLRLLTLEASGNTLAYGLTSLTRLLDLDQGWEIIRPDLIDRLFQIVASHPLVNILRGAMAILVAIVAHHSTRPSGSGRSGFEALKPAIAANPQFLESLVNRLSSADHALCANALQLINALMRDAINYGSDNEWPKFIKQLQDLGVIKAVYGLMQSTGLQDMAYPLLDFQTLTKNLLRNWRGMAIDFERQDHRRSLKTIYQAAHPERKDKGDKDQPDTDKYRSLGFETESPAWEFENVGYLGMMDLTDFARKSEDGFQKLLQEQKSRPAGGRCPVAKASLATTSILFDHFEVAKEENDELQKRYVTMEARTNFENVFTPLLLQWSRLHTAALQAFFRLWAATGAEAEDFIKIDELVRILVEQVVGLASRTMTIEQVEAEFASWDLRHIRELQMELLESTQQDAWGHHLRQVKQELRQEAILFLKEQRIRCLLAGAWFPNITAPTSADEAAGSNHVERTNPWRYVRLSHNRRYLHYGDYQSRNPAGQEPLLEDLENKLDLSAVTSVASDLSLAIMIQGPPSVARQTPSPTATRSGSRNLNYPNGAGRTASSLSHPLSSNPVGNGGGGEDEDTPLLILRPATANLAAEWLDGLLMLLDQVPASAETSKLVDFIVKYGMKIRLLNVRFEERLTGFNEAEEGPYGMKDVVLPTRDGVDDEFFYAISER